MLYKELFQGRPYRSFGTGMAPSANHTYRRSCYERHRYSMLGDDVYQQPAPQPRYIRPIPDTATTGATPQFATTIDYYDAFNAWFAYAGGQHTATSPTTASLVIRPQQFYVQHQRIGSCPVNNGNDTTASNRVIGNGRFRLLPNTAIAGGHHRISEF